MPQTKNTDLSAVTGLNADKCENATNKNRQELLCFCLACQKCNCSAHPKGGSVTQKRHQAQEKPVNFAKRNTERKANIVSLLLTVSAVKPSLSMAVIGNENWVNLPAW